MIKNNKFLLLIYIICLVAFSQVSMAVKVVVHPDEQTAMDALLKRLNIPLEKIKYISYENKVKKYEDSYLIKNRFQYVAEYQGGFSIDTNKQNRVARLNISWTDLSDLKEISNFKDIMFLKLNSNKLINLSGISNLKNLKVFDVSGQKTLVDIGDLRDLPNLVLYDGDADGVERTDGLRNLPRLEEFLCSTCKLNDLKPIGKLISLKRLTLGTTVKSLSPLSSLKNLEEIDVVGKNLVDISAVNGMTSIKSIIVHDSLVEYIDLSKNLKNLEYFRIVDSKLKQLPDFSKFKNMNKISIVRSDITSVEGINNLDKLTDLSLIENKKLTSVSSIKNLPMLVELEIERTPITTLSNSIFPNLKVLDISGTNITKLENFSNYPELRKLFLNNTKVTSLEGVEDAPYLFWIQTDYSLKSGENGEILMRLAKRFDKE